MYIFETRIHWGPTFQGILQKDFNMLGLAENKWMDYSHATKLQDPNPKNEQLEKITNLDLKWIIKNNK
jgi:hypothetical protein